MSTVAKAAAVLLGIILVSAVACGSDQSPGDIVAEPEPAATPTTKTTGPQVADSSDQAEEMDIDPEADHSERASGMDKDAEPDHLDQATEIDKDAESDHPDQAEPDHPDQATEIDKDAEPDHPDQATEIDKDTDVDHSDQAMEINKDAGDDTSHQAMETVEDTDDSSDHVMETVEGTDDSSDQALETVQDTDVDSSDQAVVTVEDTDVDSSDQIVETVEDTDDGGSDQIMETVEEEPEPRDKETVKVGRDVGERVLEFSISLEDGTVRTTQDLLSAGRPVFIYFFTTWCPVCRKDLTELQAIYPEYADEVDFIVVGQDPSEPLGELVAYRDGQGQSWPVALAGPRMLADLRITSQAFKLAFDSGGVITYRAGFGNGNPDVWRGVIADLSKG